MSNLLNWIHLLLGNCGRARAGWCSRTCCTFSKSFFLISSQLFEHGLFGFVELLFLSLLHVECDLLLLLVHLPLGILQFLGHADAVLLALLRLLLLLLCFALADGILQFLRFLQLLLFRQVRLRLLFLCLTHDSELFVEVSVVLVSSDPLQSSFECSTLSLGQEQRLLSHWLWKSHINQLFYIGLVHHSANALAFLSGVFVLFKSHLDGFGVIGVRILTLLSFLQVRLLLWLHFSIGLVLHLLLVTHIFRF